jgi:hypothetical protein
MKHASAGAVPEWRDEFMITHSLTHSRSVLHVEWLWLWMWSTVSLGYLATCGVKPHTRGESSGDSDKWRSECEEWVSLIVTHSLTHSLTPNALTLLDRMKPDVGQCSNVAVHTVVADGGLKIVLRYSTSSSGLMLVLRFERVQPVIKDAWWRVRLRLQKTKQQ